MSKFKQLTVTSALLGLSLFILSTSSMAQDSARPELSGIWTNASRTGLTRPRGIEPLVVSAEQAQQMVATMSIAGISAENVAAGPEIDPETGAPPVGGQDFGLRGYNLFWTDPGSSLALVKGEFRTSYIVNPENGQIPRLANPKVDLNRPQFGARYLTGVADASGPEAIPIAERCLIGFGNTAGPGMMGTLYNSSYQFVQTDDYVLINVEMVHDARIIPIFATAEEARANRRPAVLSQWLGDSVGWYEDDTLIIETTNINPLQMGQSSIAISQDGKITERFSRYADNEMLYQFTVDDSNLYSQPWTAELSYYPLDGRMYEYACHEGNYAMPGILAGARRAEREAGL
ncbi:MAG TPA: hypothetical protein EYQ30_10010 [Gammaproteobacteria bacterium]|nr:hypothetical protein [Gammaproteobacteria bacterium]HIL64028.1 hypothetical protein [Porticoccaceae bacterium]